MAMKKLIIIIAVVFIIITAVSIVLMAINNPTKDDFINFTYTKNINSIDEDEDQKGMTVLYADKIKEALDAQTTRTNYFLFSTYKRTVDGKSESRLGFFGDFYIY